MRRILYGPDERTLRRAIGFRTEYLPDAEDADTATGLPSGEKDPSPQRHDGDERWRDEPKAT